MFVILDILSVVTRATLRVRKIGWEIWVPLVMLITLVGAWRPSKEEENFKKREEEKWRDEEEKKKGREIRNRVSERES